MTLAAPYRILDTAIGDRLLPVFYSTSAPSNGTSGTLAGVAPPGAILLTSEPAAYQNSNTLASPTWTALGTFTGTVSATSLTVSGGTALASLTTTGNAQRSVAAGLTASTTHSIAGGTAATKDINQFSVCANAGDAATLPAATAGNVGMQIEIYNDGAANMAVYPGQAGDAIDGGTAGAAVTLTHGARCKYTITAANTVESSLLGAKSA